MSTRKKNSLIMGVITLAFLSPLLVAWWSLNFTDVIAAGDKSNHGDLISPPRPLADLPLHDPVAARDYQLHGKWNLLYLGDQCAGETCLDNLYRMRQIHAAMDKHSLRVQRVLLLREQDAAALRSILTPYAGQRIIKADAAARARLIPLFKLDAEDQPLLTRRLYIIDPRGNLRMSYPPAADPRGIIKDLKKLLKASRIG